MYTVAIKREFIAQHFLIGGDWGPENKNHSHHYQVEFQLNGQELDRHGYLIDIVEIESVLETVIARYRDKVLNQLTEFEGLNPSIEHFSRILCCTLAEYIQLNNIDSITVKLWENQNAWACYQQEFSPDTK